MVLAGALLLLLFGWLSLYLGASLVRQPEQAMVDQAYPGSYG